MIYDASENGKLLKAANEDYFYNSEGSGADFVACYGSVNAKDTTDKTIEISADRARVFKTGSAKYYKLASNGDVSTSVADEIKLAADGGSASTVIVISPSYSATDNTPASVIYIIE